MIHHPKISIIVVSYNAEERIQKSLLSIKNQTFQDFEVIMVNDGSTDNTLSILQAFAAQDKRFKLIEKSNEGVGAARRDALNLTSGEYIIHCDADDYLEPRALEFLHKAAKERNTDIIIGNYNICDAKNEILSVSNIPKEKEPYTFIQSVLDNKIHGALWNKLIKKESYVGINFEKGINYREDILVLIQICLRHNIIIEYIDCVVYNYVQNQRSITLKKKSAEYFEQTKKLIQKIDNLLRGTSINTNSLKIGYKITAMWNEMSFDYVNEYPGLNSLLLKSKTISIPTKVLFLLKMNKLSFLFKLFLRISKQIKKM